MHADAASCAGLCLHLRLCDTTADEESLEGVCNAQLSSCAGTMKRKARLTVTQRMSHDD